MTSSEQYMNIDDGGGRQRSVPVDMPDNSYAGKARAKAARESKPEKEPVTPVVTGKVIRKRPGMWRRVKAALVEGEQSETIGEFLFMEVLIPAVKTMISDAVGMAGDAIAQGVEKAMFGDVRVQSRADRPAGYISYNRVHRAIPDHSSRQFGAITTRARAQHDFSDVIVATRGEAEGILDRLRELAARYDVASVMDFYDLVGITGDFPDTKWGWYDLTSARAQHVRGGYLIVLPKTQPID